MKIQFDVDGVLADFHKAASILGHSIDPRVPILTDREVETWDWDHWPKHTMDIVWEKIMESPFFFADLPPGVTRQEMRAIAQLSSHNDLYFVTSRPVKNAKWQTEQWLWTHLEIAGTVIVTTKKADFARVVGIDWSIDDKVEHATYIGEVIGPDRSCILDRPYNRNMHPKSATRVDTVKEFLERIGRSTYERV